MRWTAVASGVTRGRSRWPGRAGIRLRPSTPEHGLVLPRIVRAGVVFVLTTPLVVMPDVFSPFVVGKAVYARSIIEITAAVWVALLLFHRRRRPSWSWTTFAFAVWLLVSGVAGALGVSPTRSLWSTYDRMQGVFDLAHWFVFTLMAGSVFRGAGDWRLLFSINLAVSSVVCAAGLAHHYQIVDVGLFDSDPTGRMSATLGNPAYLGAYSMVNAVLGAALVVQSFGRPAGRAGPGAARCRGAVSLSCVRGLWGGMVLVNLWALWLSGTRGALVGLGAAVLVFAAYAAWGRMPVMRRTAGAALAVVVFVSILVVIARTDTTPDPLLESGDMFDRLSIIGLDGAARGRIAYVAVGLRAFRDRAATGWGPENFVVAWGRYGGADAAAGHEFSDYPHNKLIEELTTKGLLGLLSYLALWAVMTSVVLRALGRLSGWDQLGMYLVGAALVSYFTQNLFLFDTAATMTQFSLLSAFVVAVEARMRTRESAPGARSSGLPATRRARIDRAAGWLAAPGRAAALTAVVALPIAPLVLLNARVYSAASAMADAVRTARPWPDRRDDFIRSIREFPGLANVPRRYLVAAAAAGLGAMSDQDFRRTVEIVTAEGGRGLADEPRNWRLAAVLAVFYQIAADREPEYLDTARRHLDRAAALAPGVPVVVAVVNEQARLEAAVSGRFLAGSALPPTAGPPTATAASPADLYVSFPPTAGPPTATAASLADLYVPFPPTAGPPTATAGVAPPPAR